MEGRSGKASKKCLTLNLTLGFMLSLEPMKREGIFIGAVSRRTGLSIHTVRFYEAEGLLPESVRTESGYRVFSPQSVEHLKFIRKAQQLGFSLDEIRELLVLRDRSTDACSHVRSLVQEKLANVHKKLQELGAMGKELKLVLAECNRQLKRHRPGRGERCPVLLKHGSISFARVALKTDFGASNRADCGLIMGKREIIADGSLHVGLKADLRRETRR